MQTTGVQQTHDSSAVMLRPFSVLVSKQTVTASAEGVSFAHQGRSGVNCYMVEEENLLWLPIERKKSLPEESYWEKNPPTQTPLPSPHPPKSFTEISEFQKAVDVSHIAATKWISYRSAPFLEKQMT